ncbi:hypothetical protein [Rickettsia argasii]|uniref:Uncharacterized protein n=1 Tax=Rickettsia argasii T170-B TaxID=1268837 RepID=A0A0F3RBE8_9RICK|nr:hypothetical protein [Rickettsia argasii]KJW03755.1 hypothetical protein RAT170B_1671 [Rickettsia argasii T170-B]
MFESIRSADFYCLGIKVNDLGLSSPPAPYISQFITKYDIASSIDLNNLIPALQGLDLEHMSSPPHDDGDKEAQFRELNKLKEELFNLKECIVLERDLKSILHGLFLYKKLNKHGITILAEMSLGHGRADLALIFKDNIPLALELGLGTSETKITQKESQLKNYIKYLKAITDARQANGVVLGFNKDATSADSIIVAKGFTDTVDHISSDDSPIRQPSLQSRPNLQDLDNPQPGPSGVQQEKRGYDADSDSKLNPRQKKLKGSLSSCPDSKKKREISFCKFSAQDLDEFSIKKTRNIDELQIDSKKFLEYLRHSNDQAKNSQLLELAKIRQIEDSDNIIGDYKYLLDRVTEAGGYNNYRQNERLESIMYNIARDTKINNQLKSKLISAAGKMQLIMGIHGAIVQCQESKDSDTGVRDCLLSVGGLTYSLASAPIENIIVKQQSKWGVRLLNSFSQVTPKILGHNTKFIFKILSAKYGVNFFKGTAGVVTGVFDIVDIGLAAQALKKCQDMAGTDNACSNREIRDYTASIIFSGVSFVSGIVLVIANATVGLTVGVGGILIVGYVIYSGISAIVEYEKKYDTTHDENWRIFWHTIFQQDLPKDVQHLAARTKSVNKILNAAWHHLQSMPDNVVAYAGGFGKVVIKNWEECKESSINRCFAVHGILSCAPPNCKRYSSSTLEPSDANIDMLSPNDGYLSRVLPNYIAGATMTCLPTQSNAIYEASGTGRSDPNVIHSCSNSFVIEHNARRNQVHDNKYIIFNTQLMTTGGITTNYTPSSIFLLGKSSINIHILSRDSQFVFLNNEFSGSIIFDASFLSYHILLLPYPLNKSFNAVFNTAMLDHNIVKFSIQSVEHFDFTQKINVINMFINDRKINLWSYYHNVIKIAYQGRKNKEDHVDCKLDESHPSVEFDLIDGGGGYSNDRPDIITGCKKVVIWPYTKIKGTEGIYHFYIRTKDVKKENSNSLIDIKGKGTVVFLDTNLLTDCEKITYSKESNTLSLQIKLGANIFYTLSIKNYLGSDGLTHNFNLIDKNSGNVIPKITESTTIISRFELHITTEHSSGQDDFSVEEVKKYYEKVSEKNKDYELYGVVKDKKNYYHFGSKGVDIIIFDEQVTFVKGGEESDIYIVTDNMDVRTIIIDNSSYDMKFDILMLSSRYDVWLETAGNDLKILIRKEKGYVEKIDYVIIYNYFKDVSYKHLIFVDEKGDAYIPFQGVDNNLRLVSFCSCSISSFVSVITASTTAVIDCELDNIEYYRIQEDLILHSSSSDSPVIIAKQFFDNQAKYNGTKIYQFNYNEQPLDFIGGANRAKDYKQLVQESYNVAIQEYEVDFSRSFNITHNHRMENGKLVPIPVDEQRTGIIIFKDIRPVRVEVTRFADDLVIRDFSYVHTNNSDEQPIVRVKNWFINHDYTISTIEFDLGLDPIRINKWDENTNTIKGDTTLIIMQNKISLAEWMTYNPSICIQTLLSPNYDILYHHWRCIVAINSKDNIIKSYEALGFNSPEEQVTFIENCEFTKDVLLQLKRSISIATEYEHCLGCNRAVLPPPNMGDNVLACKVWHRLILCGYNYTEASQIYDDLSQTLSYNRTIEGIDKILNILGNNSDETDHQRHRRSFNDHENLIISTTNWFKEKVYSFWNMISNFNILPVANGEPINENPNMGIIENCYTNENNEWQNATINSNHGIAVQYDYVQQQLPLIQYVLHHSQLVPTVKKYGVIGTIKYFIRQCENQLSNWYYHQDTGPDPDKEQFLKQICSCTNWLNKLENILIEMRTQLIKSQSSVFVQCVSEKENITPKYKVLKSYQDSIQDTKDELYQLTVKLQQQKTVTQNQIDEITILVNYTTDLTIDIIDLTNNSVWRQQLQQLLLVDKYGMNEQQDAVGARVELNTNNADINISASGDIDYHVLAYMSHILPDQLVIGSSGESLILAC